MGNSVVGLRKEFGKTVAADVAHRMREEIVTCRLVPGEPLRFESLRGAFDASFTTLREALMTLAADGLVVSEEQRGFRVAPVSKAHLLDVTHARVLIEVDAIRRAVEHGGDEWEIASMTTLHRLTKLEERIKGRPTDDPEWRRAHAQFHHALVSSCNSPVLLRIRGQLFDQSERYRCLSASRRPVARDKQGEHRAMMMAAIGRNAGLAAELVEKHIRDTSENVLKYAGDLLES
jgi:DNA-binding GntR family transcriptional regulator